MWSLQPTSKNRNYQENDCFVWKILKISIWAWNLKIDRFYLNQNAPHLSWRRKRTNFFFWWTRRRTILWQNPSATTLPLGVMSNTYVNRMIRLTSNSNEKIAMKLQTKQFIVEWDIGMESKNVSFPLFMTWKMLNCSCYINNYAYFFTFYSVRMYADFSRDQIRGVILYGNSHYGIPQFPLRIGQRAEHSI